MSTTSLIMFLTELQFSFSIYKDPAEKKLTEIGNQELVPSSSNDDIARQNCQIKS